MKLVIILTAFLCLNIQANIFSQVIPVKTDMQNTTIKDVLTTIEAVSNIRFFYNDGFTGLNKKVSVSLDNNTLDQILKPMLNSAQLTYHQMDDKFIVITPIAMGNELENKLKQGIAITGTVTENGEPLPGVNVTVKGTLTGVVTDVTGKYTITAPDKEAVLVYSFVGYTTQEFRVGDQTSINVSLNEDLQEIEEVVVIGYGSARKKDVTGAITRVDVTEKSTTPNVNPVQALRGAVAGLRVIDTGLAGTDGTIQIRGTTSITASNDPLIVLDGVPFSGGRLSDINTNDIESIDVLKDASSTAIYGSRGANGVIIISTKKGSGTKPRLSYNGYAGFSNFANLPKLMGPDKYLQLRKDAEAYMKQELPFQTIEEENIAAGRTIDAWDVIKQTAPMQEHELSLSGRGEKVSYYLSAAYTNQKSPLAGDQFQRLSVRANFDMNVTNWLQIGTNSSFTTKDFSGSHASWGNAGYLSPFSSIRYDDGSLRRLPYGDGMVPNPLWDVEMKENSEISYGIFNNNFALVKLPIKGLTYQLNLANNLRFKNVNNYTPSYDRDGFKWLGDGSKDHSQTYNLILENIVKYNNTFADVHNIDATLMYGYETSNDSGSELESNNIFSDELGYNGLGIGENPTITTTAEKSTAISSMARIGYRYSSKYMINLTVRRDGYSAFGNDRKYGVFPSVGVGWNFSEETFMGNLTWLDLAKLRLSWGRNGNRGIGPYASLSTMDMNKYVFGDGGSTSNGLYPTSMANPILGWETSQSFNAGLDFSFLRSRITGSVDVYNTLTEELLLNISVPNISGYGTFKTNIGETQNRGVELSLSSENIKTDDLLWRTSLSFSFNRNKILHLSGEDLNGDGKEDDDINQKRFIGYSMGSNFDYVHDGIWQEGDDFSMDASAKPGDIKFKDISGNGTIGPEDREVLHNNRPKFVLSLNNSFTYKWFTLSFLFDYRYGGYAPNSWTNPGTQYYNRCNQLDLPYWTPENPLSDRQSVGYSNPRSYGFYEKLTYLRLQDISLVFNLPEHLAHKATLSNVKAYISVKNLATWTNWHGWDPEHGSNGRASTNGPLIRSFVFGLQFSL